MFHTSKEVTNEAKRSRRDKEQGTLLEALERRLDCTCITALLMLTVEQHRVGPQSSEQKGKQIGTSDTDMIKGLSSNHANSYTSERMTPLCEATLRVCFLFPIISNDLGQRLRGVLLCTKVTSDTRLVMHYRLSQVNMGHGQTLDSPPRVPPSLRPPPSSLVGKSLTPPDRSSTS